MLLVVVVDICDRQNTWINQLESKQVLKAQDNRSGCTNFWFINFLFFYFILVFVCLFTKVTWSKVILYTMQRYLGANQDQNLMQRLQFWLCANQEFVQQKERWAWHLLQHKQQPETQTHTVKANPTETSDQIVDKDNYKVGGGAGSRKITMKE